MGRTVFSILSQGVGVATGYEAPPFIPAGFISVKSKSRAAEFNKGSYSEKRTQSNTGSPLRKSKGDLYYFMPVSFEHVNQKTNARAIYNFDDAIISITGKKTIVETPLIGKKGTVKELISVDDYEIKLVAVVAGDDYPEEKIQEIVKLYEINESLKMNCVVSDYFLHAKMGEDGGDRVVIKNIEVAAVEGVEDMQVITMTLLSDQNFELEIS